MRFPGIDISTLLAGRRPLILAPHPDDESLGCGGLIAASCDAGITPVVVVLTDGAASHPGSLAYPPDSLRQLREREAKHAVTLLGLAKQNLYFLRARDTALPAAGPALNSFVTQLGKIGQAHACSLIIAPWLGDPHCDHQSAAIMAATLAATQNWALASYPLWGWLREGTELFSELRQKGCKLDISRQIARKQAAIAAHRSQYGGLIQDAPTGFKLPESLLEVFARDFEVYIT
jgi:LmbE family N-acetylglucosaminyl deacetylase